MCKSFVGFHDVPISDLYSSYVFVITLVDDTNKIMNAPLKRYKLSKCASGASKLISYTLYMHGLIYIFLTYFDS
jgi:hypothetical protein